MSSSYSAHHYAHDYSRKVKKGRKSAFGGEVKSKEEVEALNDDIRRHEEAELKAFEEDFDQQWAQAQKQKRKHKKQ